MREELLANRTLRNCYGDVVAPLDRRTWCMQHRQNRCPQFLISTGYLGSPLHIGHRNGQSSTGVVEMMFSAGNPHSSSAVPHCVEQRIGLPFGFVFSRRSSYWNCWSLGSADRNKEYAINITLTINIKKLEIEFLTVGTAYPYIQASSYCVRFESKCGFD